MIDHVLYAVRDLHEARTWFADTFGLTAVSGGVHPGWGTANAIVPVGNTQYVELIGVVDAASEHPLARIVTSLVMDGDRPVAVCLRPTSLTATAGRLQLEVTEGTRSNPDGMTLRWRMAGLAAALGPERLPFFIEWPGGQGSPELDGLRHDPADGVEWVELGGQEHRVREWLGEDVPGVRTVSGPPGVHRCCIRRGGESVVLGPR